MSYGIIEYNSEGKPKCEICGLYFDRVSTHTRQKHSVSAREYKKEFGFDVKKGICSKESYEKARQKNADNYDLVVKKNLLTGGKESRFKDGDPGRTRDQVSEQTRLMLIDRAKNSMNTEHRVKLAKELGLSGKGNKARWAKNL